MTEGVTTQVICGDSRIILHDLPPADLLLADPPFDKWQDFIQVIAHRRDKTIACFTSWQHRIPIETVMGRPKAEIVWHFPDGRWVSHQLPRITHSSILIYGKTYDAFVGELVNDMTPQNKGRGSVGRDRLPERMYRPRERKMLNSVIVAPRNVHQGVWSKPDAVLRPIIEWLSPEGGVVIDAFMGAGNSLRLAHALGRSSIGIDIDPEMCRNTELRTQPMF